MLISARQDRPLDAAEQRELAAHLATCARCRAFARQVGMIRDDLHNLPVLPPSMTVTRGVLEHVNADRSPWARFLNLFGAQPLPAFATVAATLVIVALLGTLVFNRLLEGPERTPALLTAPTAQALATKQQATRNSIAPTPTATVPPPPTALPPLPNITVSLTPVPPTATPSPTSPPPTATATPAPTNTPVPTATPAPTNTLVPTETPVPTQPPTPTETPTATPLPTETPVPTETPTPPPTEAPVPTDTPTLRPTATPSPTDTPVPTPTPTEAQPPIVQRGGQAVEVGTPATSAPVVATTGPSAPVETPPVSHVGPAGVVSPPVPATTPTEPATARPETPVATVPATAPRLPTIAPVATGTATAPPAATPSETAAALTTPTIPPIESLETPAASGSPVETATPSPASTPGETPSATAAPAGDLSAAAKTGTAANPGGMLVLNGDAIQTADPAGIDLASLDTPAGSSLSTTQGKQGQAVRYCNATNACRDLSSASASGAHTDTPIGWLGTYAIYERVTPATGAVSYRAVTATGDDDHRLLTGDEGIAVRDVVIDLGDRLLIAGRGSWVLLTSDSGRVVGANPYGALAQVRAYENITPQKIGFVAGGTVFVVPIERPDAPAFQIQANAVGYDLSPDGSQLAVSDGATITVYRADGAVVGQFANGGGISIGSVLWLRQGIEFIDRTNGVIRQVDPAALS